MTKILIPEYFGQQVLSGIRALARDGDQCDLAWKNFHFLGKVYGSRYLNQHFSITPSDVNDDQFVMDVIKLCSANDYDLALPFGLNSYYAFSKHSAKISPYVRFMVSDFEKFTLANDKLKTAKFCIENGFDCPQVFSDFKDNDVQAIGNAVRYPVVIKARSACGVGYLRYAHSKKELLHYYEDISLMKHHTMGADNVASPLIQEFIPGYIHDACTLAAHGKPLAILTQIRKIMYPVSGGPGALNITTHDEPLKSIAHDILEALKWHGPAQIEFKYDERDKKYKLIEINPKLWGTLDLSIKSGVNFPLMIRDYLVDGTIPSQPSYQEGIAYKFRFPQLTLARLDLLRHFGLKSALYSPRVKKVYNDFDWNDPVPDFFRFLRIISQVFRFEFLKVPMLDKKLLIKP